MKPLATVEAFLDAYWRQDADGVIALTDPEFTWLNMAMPRHVIVGIEQFRTVMTSGNWGFPEPIEAGEHIGGLSACDGEFVFHERVDRFRVRRTWIEIACNAIWHVRADKVLLWKDYYDVGTYIRAMAGVGIRIDTSAWF